MTGMSEPTYIIGSFEGPLDLLLELIEKNRVEITDIPIALIFEQYMEYLGKMAEMDMDIAGEFIETASELMYIKSRALLPKKEEAAPEEDPRDALARRLLEYKRIRMAAQYLSERFEEYGGRFEKEQTDSYDPPQNGSDETLGPHTVRMLENAFRRIWNRFGENIRDERPIELTHRIVSQKYYPVRARIFGIIRMLYDTDGLTFSALMLSSRSRSELVASFAAVLELLKAGRIRIVSMPEDGGEPDGEDIVMRLDTAHRRKAMTTEGEANG